MADYDVGVIGLSVPPTSAPKTTYRPAVSVRNNGIHDALASGVLRIYSAGRLAFTTEVYSATIPPGETRPALATDYWTPETEGDYLFSAVVTCPLDQVESNNHLSPTKVTVTGAPPPPPTPVTSHASQHEEGGGDEMIVDGLHGRLSEPQVAIAHKTSHQKGGSDVVDVTGLPGILLQAQPTVEHHATHQDGGDDELSLSGLHGKAADAQTPTAHANEAHSKTFEDTAAKGAANGYAGLDVNQKVPAANLGGEVVPEGAFLSGDRTWAVPPGGAAQPHAATHEDEGDDELDVTGLSGVLSQAQVPKSHDNAAHSKTFEDTAAKGTASGYASLDETTRVPEGQLGQVGVGAPESDFLCRDRTWKLTPVSAHKTSHQYRGADELDITGLSGFPAAAGASPGLATLGVTGHVPVAQLGVGENPETKFLRGDNSWQTSAMGAHAATHAPAGGDEISIAGLHGEAADAQVPKNHGATHGNEGGDDISIGGLSGMPAAAGVALGLATLDVDGNVPSTQLKNVELTANKGAANGYAPLNASSRVPSANLPPQALSPSYAAVNDNSLNFYNTAGDHVIMAEKFFPQGDLMPDDTVDLVITGYANPHEDPTYHLLYVVMSQPGDDDVSMCSITPLFPDSEYGCAWQYRATLCFRVSSVSSFVEHINGFGQTGATYDDSRAWTYLKSTTLSVIGHLGLPVLGVHIFGRIVRVNQHQS